LFSNYGEVKHVKIIEGRGFGFVEMSNQSEAEKAKEALNGSEFNGRTLRVDEARPPRNRQRGDYRRY
jgi:RNA recognition motif-containing protein